MHGELLKLGFEVAGSTVSKYMIRRQGPPSQNWRTFLGNHADAIAAIDLCVVPTLTFERLFAFLVLGHGRRHLLWFAVTRNPMAEAAWPNRSWKHFRGIQRQPIFCATMMALTGKPSSVAFERWGYVTGQYHRDRLGRIDTLNA